jgi:hypothetical protein
MNDPVLTFNTQKKDILLSQESQMTFNKMRDDKQNVLDNTSNKKVYLIVKKVLFGGSKVLIKRKQRGL